jgi:hypothetical protein
MCGERSQGHKPPVIEDGTCWKGLVVPKGEEWLLELYTVSILLRSITYNLLVETKSAAVRVLEAAPG